MEYDFPNKNFLGLLWKISEDRKREKKILSDSNKFIWKLKAGDFRKLIDSFSRSKNFPSARLFIEISNFSDRWFLYALKEKDSANSIVDFLERKDL